MSGEDGTDYTCMNFLTSVFKTSFSYVQPPKKTYSSTFHLTLTSRKSIRYSTVPQVESNPKYLSPLL